MLAPEERRFVDLSIADERRKRRRLIKQGAAAAAAGRAGDPRFRPSALQQIAYGMSFARTLPAVWNDEPAIPISAAAIGNLQPVSIRLAPFCAAVLPTMWRAVPN